MTLTEVISVKFKNRGKVYYFDPAGLTASDGEKVIVETSKGLELAECAHGNHYVPDENIIPPLRPVVRVATQDDLRGSELNRRREREAFEICQQKIIEHSLEMKLVDVECNFEGSKIMFFFTSDGRVDFRDLVKDLASIFRTRIELRQIGVRDEAKMLGGLGICGRPFCCSQFLDDFQPVSTKMAKIQSMSLNPTKISGSCGRLMCCLRYEQEAYEDLLKKVPKNGVFVQTPDGYGNVFQSNVLRQSVKVKLDSSGDPVEKTYPLDEIAVVPGGRPKAGEPLPSVLVLKPRPAPSGDAGELPDGVDDFIGMPAAQLKPQPAAQSRDKTDAQAPPRKRRRLKSGKEVVPVHAAENQKQKPPAHQEKQKPQPAAVVKQEGQKKNRRNIRRHGGKPKQ